MRWKCRTCAVAVGCEEKGDYLGRVMDPKEQRIQHGIQRENKQKIRAEINQEVKRRKQEKQSKVEDKD